MFGVISDEKKALADAYNHMMQSAAWKDLERFAIKESEASVKREDSKSSANLTLCEVGEERGIRRGIGRILKYAEQCKEGV